MTNLALSIKMHLFCGSMDGDRAMQGTIACNCCIEAIFAAAISAGITSAWLMQELHPPGYKEQCRKQLPASLHQLPSEV